MPGRPPACHCAAADYDATDWPQILALYDELIRLDDSPIVALNRAVAVAKVHGARAGLTTAEVISGGGQLDSYYLLYAVLGEFEAELNNYPAAAKHFRRAADLAELKSEQTFLAERLAACEEHGLCAANN